MTDNVRYYGIKYEYESDWRGPLKIERRTTNFFFSIVYGIFIAFWIGIAGYAYSYGAIPTPQNGTDPRHINLGLSPIKEQDNNTITVEKIIAAKNIATGFIFLAAFLSLLYIILLRWFAKLFVYTAIILGCAFLLLLICILSTIYASAQTSDEQQQSLVALIMCIILLATTIICFFIFKKKIKIACEVIRESCKAVTFFPSSLLFPVLPYLLFGIIVIYTGSICAYLMGIPKVNDDYPSYVYFFHIVNIFGGVWTVCFVSAFSQMILSGSFATWYWTLNKHYVPNNVILIFMGKTLRYHIGTLALGSFIGVTFKIILMIIDGMARGIKRSFLYELCRCWLDAVDKFIGYLNRNVYIMSCIHGTGYWQSAKDAFNLLMRNVVKVVVINKVTDAILLLGQIIVLCVSLMGTYLYCRYSTHPELTSSALLLVAIFASLLSGVFLVVLRTAIDTIFLCVLEDYERNDGSTEKPYFMSFKLKELLLTEQNS